ncbi:MAG: NF038129 family PEP-CTERM protein [Akkermansiaceae bacterium]|nr:NF038129 family PEP-CTERM protein [Verrucomicrobiales bacterium]
MKATYLKQSLLLAAGLMLSTAASQAAFYRISIDTSPLNSLPASASGPFSVDFQFNSGDDLGNNTATIGNFIGAGVVGVPTTDGGASGSLASTINITDTSSFNSLFQGFTPGSVFGFDVLITENIDSGSNPDSFSFSILDNSNAAITTDGIGDSLVQLDLIAGSLAVGDLNLGSGTGDFAGITVTAIPEPSAVFTGLLACGLGMLRRRRSA